jgi:hypothetical protein
LNSGGADLIWNGYGQGKSEGRKEWVQARHGGREEEIKVGQLAKQREIERESQQCK